MILFNIFLIFLREFLDVYFLIDGLGDDDHTRQRHKVEYF